MKPPASGWQDTRPGVPTRSVFSAFCLRTQPGWSVHSITTTWSHGRAAQAPGRKPLARLWPGSDRVCRELPGLWGWRTGFWERLPLSCGAAFRRSTLSLEVSTMSLEDRAALLPPWSVTDQLADEALTVGHQAERWTGASAGRIELQDRPGPEAGPAYPCPWGPSPLHKYTVIDTK